MRSDWGAVGPGIDLRCVHPTQLPTPGLAYLVRLGFTTVNKVIFHLLPSDLSSDFQRAAWMSETGCLRQARMLLSRIK